jgi:tol-pal system protein YbgF
MTRHATVLALSVLMGVSVGVNAQTPPSGGAPVVSGAGTAAPAPTVSPETQRMLDLLNRMDQLEKEVRHLRGDMEVLSHDLKDVKDRQRELYLDVDRRLRDLEVGGVRSDKSAGRAPATGSAAANAPESGQAPTPAGSVAAGGGAAASTTLPTPAERNAYDRAFNLLKDGRYPQAISAFDAFLKAHPKSSYSDNAQYWLGEANYVSRQFKRALQEFEKVVSNYPNSPKVPDAMLKEGYTYYELHQWDQARTVLQNVIKRYPQSTARRLAETRLQRMRKEGH